MEALGPGTGKRRRISYNGITPCSVLNTFTFFFPLIFITKGLKKARFITRSSLLRNTVLGAAESSTQNHTQWPVDAGPQPVSLLPSKRESLHLPSRDPLLHVSPGRSFSGPSDPLSGGNLKREDEWEELGPRPQSAWGHFHVCTPLGIPHLHWS